MWISFGGLHCRGLCCGWSGGFIEWVVVFHVKHSAELSKLIQLLGKLIYTNRWKIRKNMSFSLVFLTFRDHSCAEKLNKLYRWTSGTYSNLFVGMIEAYPATGKIYLHQQAENQNLTWPSLHTEASHV